MASSQSTENKSIRQQRISVLGSFYSLFSRNDLTNAILEDGVASRSGYVCVSNVHTTMMGYFDPDYQRITNESTYSVPDGVPLVWAMNALSFGHLQDRVRGPTLMREVCDLGRQQNLKHYLYGGSEKTLAALKETLQRDFPGIQIVGAESPPYRPLSEQEMAAAAEAINLSGAQVLWVGLGAPKQERWMWTQRQSIKPLMLGVGAAFDLLPGIIPEAPYWLQKLGLEWLYRLFREPRRLWKRYIFNNPAFLALLAWQIVRVRLFKTR